eukprot:jgi/Botrbrau1/16645/Bobra.0068s0062.1
MASGGLRRIANDEDTEDTTSDIVTSFSTSGSESASDFLDSFIRNYTVDFVPTVGCLKLRKSVGRMSLGINSFVWGVPDTGRFMLNVKPVEKGSSPWLHKLEIAPAAKRLRITTAKRTFLGFLVGRAWAEYNLETQRFGVNWKITTRWNVMVGRTSRKERRALPDGMGRK